MQLFAQGHFSRKHDCRWTHIRSRRPSAARNLFSSTTLLKLMKEKKQYIYYNHIILVLLDSFFLCLIIDLGASQPSLENRGALSSFCSFNSMISRLWVSAAAWGDDASHRHAADPCWKEFSHQCLFFPLLKKPRLGGIQSQRTGENVALIQGK